jgi:hypothetical protein
MTSSRMGAGAPSQSTGATATIIGIVLLAFGLLCAGGAGAVLISGTVARGIGQLQGADGFLAARSLALSTDGYAVSSPAGDPLELHGDTRAVPFDLASLRMTVTSADKPVFVGIAAQRDIDRYLESVQHSEVEGLDTSWSSAEYRQVPGGAPSVPPGELDIWVASATGPVPQELQWSLTPGEWGMVVMNADGTRGVDIDMDVAARSGLLAPAGNFLTTVGWMVLLLGVGAVIAGAVILGVGQSGLRSSREREPDYAASPSR